MTDAAVGAATDAATVAVTGAVIAVVTGIATCVCIRSVSAGFSLATIAARIFPGETYRVVRGTDRTEFDADLPLC